MMSASAPAPATTSPVSSSFAPFLEALVVSSPVGVVAALAAPAGSGLMFGIKGAGEAALAHYLGLMAAGSPYGKAQTGFFSTAEGAEVEVAGVTAGLLFGWVYWNSKSANYAAKTAILAGLGSYVGAKYVLPFYNKSMKSAGMGSSSAY